MTRNTPAPSRPNRMNLQGLLAILCVCLTCGLAGCDGDLSDENIVGEWDREFAYGDSVVQYDKYHFYQDGTFDHYTVISGLNVETANSGRWQDRGDRIECSGTGFTDELLIDEHGAALLQLSNRARGVPPYRRKTQP